MICKRRPQIQPRVELLTEAPMKDKEKAINLKNGGTNFIVYNENPPSATC